MVGYFSDKSKKEHEQHFHWRHSKEKQCKPLAFHRYNSVLGLNVPFGIRGAMKFWTDALTEERTMGLRYGNT